MTPSSRSQRLDKADHGVIVPLVTPLTHEGRLDEPALRRLVDFCIAGGVQGIFVLGTTGEGPSVPRAWRSRIVHITAEQADGKARVYAGLFETSVADAYNAAADFHRQGADCLVAPLPYFYTLSSDEQFAYFARLVETVVMPVLLYDIPSLAHTRLDLGVIEHLRVFDQLIGVKDSSGSKERLEALLASYAGDSRFSVLVGSTALSGFGLLNGADGVVPSAANLEPALCARLYAAARKGDTSLVDSLQREIDSVTRQYFGEGEMGRGIARLKRMLNQRGLCGLKTLPPLKSEE